MRSSIACSRCRRSKTKCDNNGIRDVDGNLAPCKSCATGNRRCEYPAPTPATNNHPHRRESTATTAGDEVPAKKRKRPVVPTTVGTPLLMKGRLGIYEDALTSPLLTSKVWEELWAIYEKHYSVEFPFLHKRTFLGPLQKLPPVASSETGPATHRAHDPALVLAFLALTSPFHAELVAQNDSSYDTAEIYATAGRKKLDHEWSCQGDAAMQQIQAFLMLGYHDWTACHSMRGYMNIKNGVIAAFDVKKYHIDEDMGTGRELDATAKRDRFIQQESRRRTFWSCFVLDRYLSVGKNRQQTIQVKSVIGKTQIPCSDKNFSSGRAVMTRLFGESDQEYADRRKTTDEALQRNDRQKFEKLEWEDREDDGMLGRYIFALDHFSNVNKWANEGGRRSEEEGIGPWNPKTDYYKLDKRLRDIKENLPGELRLTSVNTEDHIYGVPSVTSRTYFMLHAVLMLSTSYLAPEYLPTYGFKQTAPTGPLDAPLVTEDLPADQPDYWVAKATECFEYVRDFVGILRSYKERDLVVESPFMGHAFWRAAWAAMYCHYVPKMDPSKALNSRLTPNAWDTTNQVLDSMKKKFRIPNMYSADLATVSSIYAGKRRDYVALGGSPQSTASDIDGGLQEYSAKMEVAHKQFGSFEIDGKVFTMPVDRLYMKLEKLEHEEESEGPATPHSPAVTFKTEGEEPRRSASTTTPANSTFTAVNLRTPDIPADRKSLSSDIEAANGSRSSYGPTAPQAPQHPQYNEPLQYDQTAYSYNGSTPAYPQPNSQFGYPTPYSQTPGLTQGSGSSTYDSLLAMEDESNVSLGARGSFFFDTEMRYTGQQPYLDMNYPLEQSQTQMPFMQNPHLYSAPWTGPG